MSKLSGTGYRGRAARAKIARIAAVVGVCGVGLVVTGCGSDDDDSAAAKPASTTTTAASGSKQARIAYFATHQSSYTVAAIKGIEEAIKAGNATLTTFDANLDPRKQAQQIQDATTSGKFDGFLILPSDGTITPQVKTAIDKGIKVASHNIAIGDPMIQKPQIDGMAVHVGTDIKREGQAMGDLVVQACEGVDPCKVAYLRGVPAMPFDAGKFKIVDEVVKGQDNIELVGEASGGFERGGGLKAAQDLLQKTPDLNVILSHGDTMGLGALQAVGRAGSDAKIIGVGSTRQGVENVKSGKFFGTTTQLPIDEGRIATEKLLEAVGGGESTGEGIDAAADVPLGPFVTKTTLEKDPSFTGQWEG